MVRRGRPPLGPAVDGKEATRLSEAEELALASRIATAFYLEEDSMVQIAERFGITRFQVARLLQLARQSGIVTIEIRQPGAIDEELSAAVAAHLGIERAVVISGVSRMPREEIGRALAEVIAAEVQPGDIVGLTWSRTMVAMVQQLKQLEPCTLVQLAGQITSELTAPGSVELIRRAAEVAKGKAYPIYAPLLAPDNYVAHALLQQRDIATAMSFYERLSVAVISIGAWAEDASSVYEIATESERVRGQVAGVVGEISGRLYDVQGHTVPQVIDDRVIGITLEQLARVPRVIASSYGEERAAATRAAAAASIFQTLVLDRSLARALLDGPGGAGV